MKKQVSKKRSMGKLVVLNEEELIQQVSIRPVLYNRSLKAYRKTPLRQQYWNEVSASMDATMEECRRRWRSLRDSFAKHYKRNQRSAEENVVNKHRKWIFYDQMSFLIPYLDSASYELDDNLLDEFGDNSEDGQSIACEPILNTDDQAIDKESQTNDNEHEGRKLKDEHHNDQIHQATVSVQATEFMPMQDEAVVMENNDHHNNHQHIMRSDFARCPNNHNTAMSLQCTETSTDYGHVMDSDEKFLLSCAPALRRLTNRQKALARLKIQQILFDIEFGQQQS